MKIWFADLIMNREKWKRRKRETEPEGEREREIKNPNGNAPYFDWIECFAFHNIINRWKSRHKIIRQFNMWHFHEYECNFESCSRSRSRNQAMPNPPHPLRCPQIISKDFNFTCTRPNNTFRNVHSFWMKCKCVMVPVEWSAFAGRAERERERERDGGR